MTVSVAEGWVKEATAQTSSSTPSHMVSVGFYENAIQAYRMIPRAQRAACRVDERIGELRTCLNESGKGALGEMGVIRTQNFDISRIVEDAPNAVSGKTAIDALKAFANLYPGAELLPNVLQ